MAKIDPKNVSFENPLVGRTEPAPAAPPSAPRVPAGKPSGAAPNVNAFRRMVGSPAGRSAGIFGPSPTRNAEVMVAGVKDTVAGHLERTMEEMNPPPLTALEGLLREVLS